MQTSFSLYELQKKKFLEVQKGKLLNVLRKISKVRGVRGGGGRRIIQ